MPEGGWQVKRVDKYEAQSVKSKGWDENGNSKLLKS
jgi:hypothetical protein